jgi:hypothetical protein
MVASRSTTSLLLRDDKPTTGTSAAATDALFANPALIAGKSITLPAPAPVKASDPKAATAKAKDEGKDGDDDKKLELEPSASASYTFDKSGVLNLEFSVTVDWGDYVRRQKFLGGHLSFFDQAEVSAGAGVRVVPTPGLADWEAQLAVRAVGLQWQRHGKELLELSLVGSGGYGAERGERGAVSVGAGLEAELHASKRVSFTFKTGVEQKVTGGAPEYHVGEVGVAVAF